MCRGYNINMIIDTATEILLWLIGVWITAVAGITWYISKKIMPGIRNIMEHGTEAEKREVIKAVFPPRFKR
jgi:hypothetical protein